MNLIKLIEIVSHLQKVSYKNFNIIFQLFFAIPLKFISNIKQKVISLFKDNVGLIQYIFRMFQQKVCSSRFSQKFFFTYYNIQYILMIAQMLKGKINKNKIVTIQLNYKNDIKIDWDFHGLLMPKVFRRHVFICLSWKDKQILKAIRTMGNCFEFFKYGDLYSFSLPNFMKLTWFQKTKLDQPKTTLSNNLQELKYTKYCNNLRRQLISLSKYKEPCFVTLFCDQYLQISQLERFLLQLREKEKLSCFIFIISEKLVEKTINFTNGICRYGIKDSNFQEFQQLYKFYNDHLACLKAEILFDSLSGDVFIQENVWKPISFNSFNRKIYYPLACILTDILQTSKLSSDKLKLWNFTTKLEYKLLNGDVFNSTKQITIPIKPEIEKCVTYSQNFVMKKCKFQLFSKTELDENPFYNISELQAKISATNN